MQKVIQDNQELNTTTTTTTIVNKTTRNSFKKSSAGTKMNAAQIINSAVSTDDVENDDYNIYMSDEDSQPPNISFCGKFFFCFHSKKNISPKFLDRNKSSKKIEQNHFNDSDIKIDKKRENWFFDISEDKLRLTDSFDKDISSTSLEGAKNMQTKAINGVNNAKNWPKDTSYVDNYDVIFQKYKKALKDQKMVFDELNSARELFLKSEADLLIFKENNRMLELSEELLQKENQHLRENYESLSKKHQLYTDSLYSRIQQLENIIEEQAVQNNRSIKEMSNQLKKYITPALDNIALHDDLEYICNMLVDSVQNITNEYNSPRPSIANDQNNKIANETPTLNGEKVDDKLEVADVSRVRLSNSIDSNCSDVDELVKELNELRQENERISQLINRSLSSTSNNKDN